MQSSQHTLRRERLIILHKVYMPDMGLKLSKLEYFAEITTTVAKPLGFYNPNSFDILLNEIHFLFYLMKRWAKLTIFED